jgi:hypothetical protein
LEIILTLASDQVKTILVDIATDRRDTFGGDLAGHVRTPGSSSTSEGDIPHL